VKATQRVEIRISLLATQSSDYQGSDVIMLMRDLLLMKHTFKRRLPRSHQCQFVLALPYLVSYAYEEQNVKQETKQSKVTN
jgi:hypothetical protein